MFSREAANINFIDFSCILCTYITYRGLSWSWSYGSWIYNYLCNQTQCLSPLTLWVLTLFMGRCTRYNIMWSSLSVTCNRSVVFSGYSFSSTNKTDCHDITEILLKVVLNTINQNYITYINIIKSYPHRCSHCNFRIIYHQKHKTLFKWISNGCQEGFSPFAIGICCLPCWFGRNIQETVHAIGNITSRTRVRDSLWSSYRWTWNI